jgi:Zn-dependent metalloprotease
MRHTILPPYLFDRLARSGDRELRALALDTLAIDHTLRIRRSDRTPPVPAAREAASTPGRPRRTVYDVHNAESGTGGTLVRSEGGPATGDAAADEAYDGLGDTYDLYWKVFQRDSIDGAGLPLVAWVHYGADYDNAFWDGTRMVFGDGDGRLFLRFTGSLDVIGHELTHGVTASEIALEYTGQSGALNESVSDVFGSLVKQHALGQSASEADWLIGADLLAPGIDGVALRSMKAPGTAYDDPLLGKDPQPATMDGYVTTAKDSGGVHTNSGIPNHAFYLLATALGGNAWDRAGHVWYGALTDRSVPKRATFSRFAQATVAAAHALEPEADDLADAVTSAWSGVGVDAAAAAGS